MDSKFGPHVGSSQPYYFCWLAFCNRLVCLYAHLWLHLRKGYSIILFLFCCILYFCLLNPRCHWWKTGQKNKVKLSFGTVIWPWMWFFLHNFFCFGFLPGYKALNDWSFYHFYCISGNLLDIKLDGVQYRNFTNKRGTVRCNWSWVSMLPISHSHWCFWAKVLADYYFSIFTRWSRLRLSMDCIT